MPRSTPSPALDELFPPDGAVLLDGAMGTALLAAGWPTATPTVLANLEAPDRVAAVHRSHRDAGAQVLASNTFVALQVVDEARREAALRAGVHLAREAAGSQARVAGCLAAVGLADRVPALRSALEALRDEGVDLLLFETALRHEDARAALHAARDVAPRVPLVISVSTTDGGEADHARARALVAGLRAEGGPALEVGLNCGRGPDDLLTLQASLAAPVRWIAPNTGLPAPRDAGRRGESPGRGEGSPSPPSAGPVDDRAMAAFARRALASGARFVGACCGSTPATLRSMAAVLTGANP